MTSDRSLPSGFTLWAFNSVGSTNDEARRLATGGAPDGTVVWARQQTKGRGRRGREWVSPPGNLFCSIILRPDCSVSVAAQLSFVSAISLIEAVESAATEKSVDVRGKWPNDVLVNGRKVAGILLECQSRESSGGNSTECAWIIIGAGVNVANHPADTEFPATSLAAEIGQSVAPERVLESYVESLSVWRGRWREYGFSAIREEWLKRAAGLGGTITVRLPTETLDGRFDGLDESGALVLESEGRRRHITSADVFFGNRV
ncbi:MAG: biotin--[acetyl-CoA-carboxylase] ligase [Rhodospirillales bacterium]|nr:biotin--[acetyl-CoA-carboxylase] ligase [Rhodospirillales bacterium]MCW9003597.1 biotin--[acetyl-CoA-carboxylase] ligase [Rhodospirillales bacterium]